MFETISIIMQKINEANGFGLALVGMGVVFSGLVTLFMVMVALHKTIEFIELKQTASAVKEEKPAGAAGTQENKKRKTNNNEIAAAIGLAMHLHKIKNAAKGLTIQKNHVSPWKQARRSSLMEGLN